MLVHQLIDAKPAEAVAVVQGETRATYGELRERVARMRDFLYAKGVRRGARVAIYARKSVHYVAAYLAVSALGAIAVPINYQLNQQEIGYILRDAGAKHLLTDKIFDWTAHERTQDLAGVLVELPIDAYEMAACESAPALAADFTDAEPYIIIYTSGTTGRPKGALLSQANVTYNAQQVQDVLHIETSDRILCVLPLYHCFCLITGLMNPLLAGATIVLFDAYTIKDIVKTIRDDKLTVLYLVPSIASVLLKTAEASDLASARYTIIGGTTLPMQMQADFEARFHQQIIEGYGLSEASPVVSVNPPGRVKPGTIGPALPGIEVRVVDGEDHDVPQGEKGQLLVRGGNVMMGYWHLPEATAETLRGGWLHTGDIVTQDADGYLAIVDRIKEMFISMGENVYPREVEELIYEYPGIKDAAVIGVPDKSRGQVGACYYTTKDGAEVKPRALKKYLQQNLAIYKVPRSYEELAELPLTATGKIAKKELERRYFEQAKKE